MNNNIFIKTYHFVKGIFKLPGKIIYGLKNKENKKLIDETEQMLKETEENSSYRTNKSIEFAKNKYEEQGLKKIPFTYVAKNDFNQVIKSSFDAYSKAEVEAFLTSERYKIISIEAKKKYEMDLFPTSVKIDELSFILTQLSTYIKAGIPLIDSVRIIAKQTVNPSKRKIYERIVYDLTTGENFSEALASQEEVFPKLLINMIKTSEMTGDLTGTLDEMAEYYRSISETRKQMITAMIYPVSVFIVSLFVVAFILIGVVPNFVKMYSVNSYELPWITLATISASNFLTKNYLIILGLSAILIYLIKYLNDNIKSFRKAIQTLLMKLPVIGNIIIYNEVTMFTKTFASLLNHGVHITDSMDILSKISNNEVYKEIIVKTLNTLSKGGRISESFRGNWAFPIVAYEMLVTGESTGQLGVMMDKVSIHYASLHKNAVNAVKSLIEPMTIIVLAFVVGFILLSVVVPMFGMFTTF